MTKADLIFGLGILLSLDKPAQKDLEKLKKETLELMFDNYKQNAIDANNRIDDATNKYTPPTRGSAHRGREGRSMASMPS